MKKYRLYDEYGDCFVTGIDESEEHEYDPDEMLVKYSDIGWKKNCEETPVPRDGKSYLLRVAYEDDDNNIHIYHEVEWYDKELQEFLPGTTNEIITHWMEIPEVPRRSGDEI